MSEIVYPTRCVIIDIDGADLGNGMFAATPQVSMPHVGKHGLAEREDEWTVRITLDDGNIIYGYQCWWMPESDWETRHIRKDV